MSLRPVAARWFEVLAAREDAAAVLELLAATGAVELETKEEQGSSLNLQQMRALVEKYQRLEQRYHAYWPHRTLQAGVFQGGPCVVLHTALSWLERWEARASPLIGQLESLTGKQRDLNLFADLLRAAGDADIDYARLTDTGPALLARQFVLPPHSVVGTLPEPLLVTRYNTPVHDFLLVLGTPESIEALVQLVAAVKGRVLPVPDFVRGKAGAALQQVERHLADLNRQIESLQRRIEALAESYRLHAVLGEIRRLDWFLNHIDRVPVSRNFAWITGWTSDLDGQRLAAALNAAAARALVHFPPPPASLTAPMVLKNPPWGRPFEAFVRMLGTPGAGEADPSRLLALLVPLMFGYMFADVGQGLVLAAVGLVLRRRWPVLDILVVNGLAAVLFGFVFGSFFGREDVIPALWLYPMAQPLPVLQVPLVAGVLVLLLGLGLKARQYFWQGRAKYWWRVEAPQLLLYVSVLLTLYSVWAAVAVVCAVIWYVTGCRLQHNDAGEPPMAAALAGLLENLLQLIINTLSFVRTGAFALAHSGLSLAFITLADMPESALLAVLILLFGNLLIILLEGLVVTIQTTRLILFEFFIRFLSASGRVFQPLVAPAPRMGLGSET